MKKLVALVLSLVVICGNANAAGDKHLSMTMLLAAFREAKEDAGPELLSFEETFNRKARLDSFSDDALLSLALLGCEAKDGSEEKFVMVAVAKEIGRRAGSSDYTIAGEKDMSLQRLCTDALFIAADEALLTGKNFRDPRIQENIAKLQERVTNEFAGEKWSAVYGKIGASVILRSKNGSVGDYLKGRENTKSGKAIFQALREDQELLDNDELIDSISGALVNCEDKSSVIDLGVKILRRSRRQGAPSGLKESVEARLAASLKKLKASDVEKKPLLEELKRKVNRVPKTIRFDAQGKAK